MGVDIHMFICRKGEILGDDIFDGRNSEWFNNLQHQGWGSVYDHLSIKGDFSKDVPEDLRERFNDPGTFYGHHNILVKDFAKWFKKYRPDLDAGWFSTYDRWRMICKGWVPDPDYVKHELEEGDNPVDYEFVEFEDEYDCSRWLYNYVVDKNIPEDATINYCFDC